MIKLFEELKRRNVVKAAISFVVLSYATLEVASILFPIWGIDKAYIRYVFISLAIVFPFWLIFSYIYEWTPQGFKKTDKIVEEESIHKTTSKRLNKIIITGLSLVIVLLLVDKVFKLTGDISIDIKKEYVIAVLPFSHESAAAEGEFFTSGVYSDAITRLSGVKQFKVIAKSAVAEYKDYQGDLKVIGKRFKANYILQGTVRRWENKVKLTAQLTDASTNETVWSDEYNAELEDVFELQADLATKITEKLQANLSPEEKSKVRTIPTENVSAYEDYLRARYLVNQPRAGYEEFQEGVQMLERAIEADPKFAKAYTLLIEIHSARYSILSRDTSQQVNAKQAKDAVIDYLDKAKSLAPDNAELLIEQGYFLRYIENDALGALKAFEKAAEQNPSDTYTLGELAKLYIYFDEPEKTLDAFEKVFHLTKQSGPASFQLSMFYEVLGHYDKLVPLLEELYEFYPKEKHYMVEAKYYQFLLDGKLESFRAFEASFDGNDTDFPWDERAIKNKEMVVAMFNNEFEHYHEKWEGHMAQHTNSHNGWICPMVANDNLKHARVMLEKGDASEGQEMLKEVEEIVLRPTNLYSVCTFNPEVYLPKLDFLFGKQDLAREKLDRVALTVLQNKSFPTGAVERAVLVEAADLIAPEKVYYYYEQVTKNAISYTSFEAICADPWTYPNLMKAPQFIAEVKEDGRFVEFLESFGFLEE